MKIMVINLKGINVTLSEKAHKNLKSITEQTQKNQHEILSLILEKVDTEEVIREKKL